MNGFADILYIVKPGDTLSAIAAANGLCTKGPSNSAADWADCIGAAQRIADYNSLPDVNSISVGRQLVLPSTPVAVVDTPAGPAVVAAPQYQASDARVWWMFAGIGGVIFFLSRGRRGGGSRPSKSRRRR